MCLRTCCSLLALCVCDPSNRRCQPDDTRGHWRPALVKATELKAWLANH